MSLLVVTFPSLSPAPKTCAWAVNCYPPIYNWLDEGLVQGPIDKHGTINLEIILTLAFDYHRE